MVRSTGEKGEEKLPEERSMREKKKEFPRRDPPSAVGENGDLENPNLFTAMTDQRPCLSTPFHMQTVPETESDNPLLNEVSPEARCSSTSTHIILSRVVPHSRDGDILVLWP